MNFYCEACGERIFPWDNKVIRCIGERYYHKECWLNEIIESDAFKRRHQIMEDGGTEVRRQK